jgi:hypothetical protein
MPVGGPAREFACFFAHASAGGPPREFACAFAGTRRRTSAGIARAFAAAHSRIMAGICLRFRGRQCGGPVEVAGGRSSRICGNSYPSVAQQKFYQWDLSGDKVSATMDSALGPLLCTLPVTVSHPSLNSTCPHLSCTSPNTVISAMPVPSSIIT